MAEWKKGQKAAVAKINECARIMLHVFVYVIVIATWLAVSVVLVLD